MKAQNNLLVMVVLATTALFSTGASARTSISDLQISDGVTIIDQEGATTGNVTPGDLPGFPVSITQPGSYKLSTNLTGNNTSLGIISVEASNVTLDLNGFTITGPGRDGVFMKSTLQHSNITVLNGSISGMSRDGILLVNFIGPGIAAQIDRVKSSHNGRIGIWVGENSTVANSTAGYNGTTGIQSGEDNTVKNNIVYNNGSAGIFAEKGNIIKGNTARNNQESGIHARNNSVITHNTSTGNQTSGILADTGCTLSFNTATINNIGFNVARGSTIISNTARNNANYGLQHNTSFAGGTIGYAHNVFDENNNGNSNPQVNGGVEIGANICGDNSTCP